MLGGGPLATPTTFTTAVVQTSTQYTDAESLILRSTVGRVADAFLFQDYGKVAIVTGIDPACVAFSSAAYAASKTNSTKIIVYNGNVDALAREIAAYGPDAVFIAFGANYGGDVLLHAFALRATKLLSTALDPDLSQWLSQRTVKGVVPDLANRRVDIVQFTVASNRLQPQTTITSFTSRKP